MKNQMKMARLAALSCLCTLGVFTARAFDLVSLGSFAPIVTNNFTTNANGAYPLGGLAVSGDTIFGTTPYFGPDGSGTIFTMSTSGGTISNLYVFSSLVNGTNSDGFDASSTLLLSGNMLYGTAEFGGTNNSGTVFAINTNGSGFTVLHTFTGSSPDGGQPIGALILSGGVLYGTAFDGGTNGTGSVFSVDTNGNNFTTIYSFTGQSDGANPYAGVVLSGDALYGTASSSGGEFTNGTVFAVETNGSNFTLLHQFSGLIKPNQTTPPTNYDGASPYGALVVSGSKVYGTASLGGAGGVGTLFSVNADSSGFTVLHQFKAISVITNHLSVTVGNSDGALPRAGLIQSGSTLYGPALSGGSKDLGTIFSYNTDTSDFTTLASFSNVVTQGYLPESLLVFSSGTLYGPTASGGKNGTGNIFSLALGASQATIPQFIAEPQSVTNPLGSTVMLYGDASGTPSPKYQWYFNNKKLSGAISSELRLPHATTADAGSYYVVASNSAGSTPSTIVTVTIAALADITSPPSNVSEPTGGTANFTVKATGSSLTYLWLFNGLPLANTPNISGATSNVLAINFVNATNVGAYEAVVVNNSGSVTSKVAELTLKAETTKPTVAIINPKSGTRSTNIIFNGTAWDAVRVASVYYTITNMNDGTNLTFTGQATLSAGRGSSSNWTIMALPSPGSNVLAVQSWNYAGAAGLGSAVVHLPFFYEVTTPFQLNYNPTNGAITGEPSGKGGALPTNGAALYVGEGYTLTAKPAKGWTFTSWTQNGAAAGTNKTFKFIMESNLVVTANFTATPVGAIGGEFDQEAPPPPVIGQ